MKAFFALALAALIVAPGFAGATECAWPAWQNFRQAMLSSDGRVIDHSSEQLISTSEGQSYGLFFALLGNDRDSFAKVLRWTQDNLAGGDLNRQLPAWQWGRDNAGRWQVLDSNNATDADLWIAYSLLEAGRLWHQPDYLALGRSLLWRSAAQSLRKLPGLGLMLLPGDSGFENAEGWRLNASYLPPQLLARFALEAPIWAELASNTERLLIESSPKGLVPDWQLWKPGQGWAVDSQKGSVGSYDAIRVYLWLGMLDKDTPGRTRLIEHFKPMLDLTARRGHVPEKVDTLTGLDNGAGPVGFSAALLPLLAASPDSVAALKTQRQRLQQQPPLADAYYNQSLMLFGQGWDQQRYRFDKNGRLVPNWIAACKK
ncbi:cellulose synthase complex periplasmic endoglucanase BcsZ [Pseudomonas sp. CFII68]|uniref:cellulose synthase complex periplasmic endoglucanase BcsZ n=1 Tax=Pseudomonas sp. CFII68 TaxID=911243 RepID=UPI0003551F0B|nr:cellulose synthase complex periplasmic endoglucanase BcsZ [Pseudomonas sp. CFII68]EPJ78370.1 endo-1,4-D-glucanase [Pseudomonas sp. CFII68]